MAEITKQALKVDNNQSFPNNNNGVITPTILRGFNVNMIDSLVDEIGYNVDSASWNQQIDALEQFTASASGLTTGSLLITASAAGNVITFTKGNNSTFNVTVADTTDLSQLNQATASLQAYTASANIKFANLESTTASLNSSITQLNASSASQQVSINNLNTTTASLLVETQNLELFSASALISITNLNQSSASQQTQINSLIAGTGSYATTGSNIFVSANTFTSISASSFVSASQFVGDGSKITNITASIALPILDEGIPQGNAFSMNFTGSAISAIVVGGTAVVSVNVPDTGSFNSLTASFNAYTASTNSDLNAIHQATASLQTNSASVNTSITNLNANSASVNTSITNINSATASLNTSASLALTTASFDNGTRNLTFTKGDSTTFNVNIPDVSGSVLPSGILSSSVTNFIDYSASVDSRILAITGSSINTGSFATTGSNTFIGNQTISGSLFVSGSEVVTGTLSASALRVENNTHLDGTLRVTNDTEINGDVTIQSATPNLKLRDTSGGGFSSGYDIRVDTGSFEIYDDTHNRDVLSDFFDSASASHTTSLTSEIIVISGSMSVTLIGNVSASVISSSIINGLGDPLAFSQSVDARILAITGSTIDTGSFATTGSNVFTGDQTFIDGAGNTVTLSDASGSLMLVAKTFTSASLHLSASAGNQVNLIFKNNNNTADTIISGSNNIFQNPAAPAAGFKRYIGNNNIALGAGFPQISGSMQFSPTINANYIGGNVTMRGPVSASLMQVNTNSLLGSVNIGSSAILNAEKLTGVTAVSTNFIAGTLSLIANQSEIRNVTNINNNNINGVVTLNLSSSTTAFANNTINDTGFTFTNQYSSGSLGFGQIVVAANTIGGGGNNIIVTGSQQLNTATLNPGIFQNALIGQSNRLFVNASGATLNPSNRLNQSIVATTLLGSNLIVSGSSDSADGSTFGSAFVGRFNADDSIRNRTSDIVFAVGTGTSVSNRKTGFLIDTGSNSFFEGVVNISGSLLVNGVAPGTTDTGSLLVTASVNLNTITFTKGDASTFNLTVDTGSGGGGGAAFPFTGSAQITGSLGITGSFNTLPITLSVAASTASIDMRAGNTFVLNIPTGSTTHIIPTNIIAGQTINLLVKQAAGATTGSLSYSPIILFPSGLDMIPTSTGSAIDLISMISFDTTNLMAANIKNLK